jgi:hypothetical protein
MLVFPRVWSRILIFTAPISLIAVFVIQLGSSSALPSVTIEVAVGSDVATPGHKARYWVSKHLNKIPPALFADWRQPYQHPIPGSRGPVSKALVINGVDPGHPSSAKPVYYTNDLLGPRTSPVCTKP